MINLLRNVYAKFEDCFLINCYRKCRVRDRMVVGSMPMPITTKVASSNLMEETEVPGEYHRSVASY
jgi:hypothetical protein